MKYYYILLKNGKYVCEKEWQYLVDVSSKEEATQFTKDESDQIIKYRGEGEKILCQEK